MANFINEGDYFWLQFSELIKVLGLKDHPNKTFTPDLMKAVCMGRRYYLAMESRMERECPECYFEKHYSEAVERPHPVCSFFKTHPKDMFDKFWVATSYNMGALDYHQIQMGALNELKSALMSQKKPKEWTDGLEYDDVIRRMNLFKESEFKKELVDNITMIYMKYVAMGDIYRI